jgi:hypothetical protein
MQAWSTAGASADPHRDALDRLDALARLLDSAVRVPGTNIRFGADAVLNLIPGVGLLTSKGLSAYLIWEAHRLGIPASTLTRMIGNLGVDFVISSVPILGWIGDVFYRANRRNIALLREHLARRAAAGSRAGRAAGMLGIPRASLVGAAS